MDRDDRRRETRLQSSGMERLRIAGGVVDWRGQRLCCWRIDLKVAVRGVK